MTESNGQQTPPPGGSVEIEGHTVTFVVRNLEYREEAGLFGTRRQGYSADVETSSGHRISVSQLEGEAPQWGMDVFLGPNSEPFWVHSFGEREGLRVNATIPEIEEVLNTARDEYAATCADAEEPPTSDE
ncbi:hypothetical protein JK358_38270 [Nocardia sp. 2]|uniref:Uncharacterized protein n=1 Tax=Nocardia acididurans TaxID=2802282 RepID=A0ABS1MLI0_9NOCA|nr:hypothetical protein [Nocardia acididurans]MBL1080258.1 hypothetical protein [Nocardia acididurans]